MVLSHSFSTSHQQYKMSFTPILLGCKYLKDITSIKMTSLTCDINFDNVFKNYIQKISSFSKYIHIHIIFFEWFSFDRHAQAISSIQAFAHWLSQFYSETHKVNLDKDKFASLISTLLDSIVPMFSKEVNSYY